MGYSRERELENPGSNSSLCARNIIEAVELRQKKGDTAKPVYDTGAQPAMVGSLSNKFGERERTICE